MITRLLGVALMMVAATAVGQTLYVSDQLVITVRTGPSTSNSIITNLVTGDAVEVLQANAETGYTRVRIQSGVEGWVLGRYLVATPVSQDRLIIAESDLAEAQATVATLEGSVAMLAAELEVTGRRLEETETENASLTKELADLRAASENVLSIRDQNESLRRRLNERNEEAELLAIDNDLLRSRATRDWFIAGGGVLLAGIIVGLIAPGLRRRRRSQW